MLKAKLLIKGNVGKIESSFTPNGDRLTKFSVAVNFGKDDKKETDWHYCTAWGKLAELIDNLVDVGTHVLIEGEFRLKKWTDKNGNEKLSPELTVRDFDVLAKGKKKSEPSDDEPEYMKD